MGSEDRRRSLRFPIGRQCLVGWDGDRTYCSLGDISAVGALLSADVCPPLGTPVCLSHDSIGSLNGVVVRHCDDGFAIAFKENEESVLYALRVITLGMSQPWRPGKEAESTAE